MNHKPSGISQSSTELPIFLAWFYAKAVAVLPNARHLKSSKTGENESSVKVFER